MRSYRHTIILIHGIAGKKDDFGAMVPALMTKLNLKDDTNKYIVIPWSYNTSDDSATTADFSRDLANFVANLKLKKEDKLSFITHSQGAIVFHLWLADRLAQKEKNILRSLDFFIALAPPYWGAKMAEFGVTIKKLAKSAGLSLPLPFGKRQLEELSYGSDTIYQLRTLISNPFYDKIRILTVAGKAQIMNLLATFSAGKNEFEDDTAVPISSTRCGYIHSCCQENQVTEIHHGEYYVVEALHISPSPGKIAGISQVTDDCIYQNSTSHPTYQLIEDFILDKPLARKLDLTKCSSFLIDINIQLAPDLPKNEQITINFSNADGSPLNNNEVEISRFLEPFSSGKNESDFRKHFYYSGTILKKTPQQNLKNHQLKITITTQSGISRELVTTIKATFSTFLDILLSPNRP